MSSLASQFQEIANWMLDSGPGYGDLRSLTDEIIARMRSVGVPLERVNLGVFALHPELVGYAVLWDASMERAVEIPVRREDTLKPLYTESPIRRLVETRAPVCLALEDPATGSEFPIIAEFRAAGHTEYLGYPVPYGDGGIAILTCNTRRPGGFTPQEREGVQSLFPVLRLLIQLVETQRLAETVLRTYLGRDTAKRVLDGEILRGEGEEIIAALWLCDLRGFTSMTTQLGTVDMIATMNDYFDCMAEAVWNEQGEILKFMGDAMLVVFRIDEKTSEAEAAERGLRSATDALRRLATLSEARIASGKTALRAGIALHIGTVIYGNIGASTRLDFTVMGQSVNLVARIQQLTGVSEEPLLFSSEIAEHLEDSTTSAGEHSFKGIEAPVEVFKLSKVD